MSTNGCCSITRILISETKKDTTSLVSVIADAKKHVSNSDRHLALLAHYTTELQDSVTRYLGKMMASQLFDSSDMITFQIFTDQW